MHPTFLCVELLVIVSSPSFRKLGKEFLRCIASLLLKPSWQSKKRIGETKHLLLQTLQETSSWGKITETQGMKSEGTSWGRGWRNHRSRDFRRDSSFSLTFSFCLIPRQSIRTSLEIRFAVGCTVGCTVGNVVRSHLFSLHECYHLCLIQLSPSRCSYFLSLGCLSSRRQNRKNVIYCSFLPNYINELYNATNWVTPNAWTRHSPWKLLCLQYTWVEKLEWSR